MSAVQLPIFLDNHSTTRTDPGVLQAMLPFFCDKYGNAASVNHSFGWEARDAVEAAREQVSGLINAAPQSLIFTSGATEANNIAIKGVMRSAGTGSHLIVNQGEHRAVLDPARRLKRAGFQVTFLPVNRYGMVDPESVAAAIQPNTTLVSLMMANNEVGTLNPIADVAAICRQNGVLFHTDAVQAVARIPIDVSTLPVDLLSMTAHKFYGPKGIGALYVRRGAPRIKIDPLFDGGGHENHLRSGTLPVPLIVGFGECCVLADQLMVEESQHITQLRSQLWDGLNSAITDIAMNGHPTQRLAGNLNISIDGVDGEALMTGLTDMAVSSGSACTSANPEPSHVLRAMGIGDQLTRASLRFGIGRFNTKDEIDYAIATLVTTIQRLRQG